MNVSNQRGVTLIEALIVVALIAMIAGLSYPSISSGLDTLRLRSTSDAIVSFLNIALDHADRRQQAVEVVISPHENLMLSRTADLGFTRRLDIPSQIQIVAVLPALPAGIAPELDPEAPRRFLLYPGGSVPRIGSRDLNAAGSPSLGEYRSHYRIARGAMKRSQQRRLHPARSPGGDRDHGHRRGGNPERISGVFSERCTAHPGRSCRDPGAHQDGRAVGQRRSAPQDFSRGPVYPGRGRRHARGLAGARHAYRSQPGMVDLNWVIDRIELEIWWMDGATRHSFSLESYRRTLLPQGQGI
jgi:prepilin-type N-terminal cleavage/methylation domain-containing protein